MKIKLLSAIFLVLLVALNGCSVLDPETSTGSAVKDTVCNAPYFEFKSGECCLDKDADQICDSDEDGVVEETTPTETTPTPTETKEVEEVEITVNDACTGTTYFECLASYLTKDEIFFKLKTTRDGYTHLKKISALGCEKVFADKPKANQGYSIRTETLVSLPCTKLKAGDEVNEAEYIVEYVFYPIVGIDSDTGEWTGVERNLMRSSGTISGTVRNEPKSLY
ncbi:MAG: hypothetical protein KKG75_04900 [Nanoarchaeota archaeon]|nr:hypothetical protein [Nanoarchaeota archaeon]